MISSRPLTKIDIENIKEIFVDADISLIKGIYFFDGWSTYEECGGILIFKGIDDSIQVVEYGYSVYSTTCINHFNLNEIKELEMEYIVKKWTKDIACGFQE